MALPARELRKSAAPMRAAGRRLLGGGAAPRRAEGIAAPLRSTGNNRIFPNNAKPQRAVNPNNPVIKPDVETPGSKFQGRMNKVKDFTARNKAPIIAGAAAGTAGYAAGRVRKSDIRKAASDKIITRAGTILSPANNRLQRRIAGHGANVARRGSTHQILKSSKFAKRSYL